ncbi:MAG: transposase [Patescibacteria group bacterium]
MKNRDYKEFTIGEIYHVYNRGNNREKIFLDEQDYRAFIFRLGLSLGFSSKELSENPLMYFPRNRIRINSKPNLFRLHSFCLMSNHFHLLIEQITETSISNMMLKLCTSYSMYFNKKYKRVGNVFQDCFKSVLVKSNPQLMWNSAYIHMNPVIGNLVDNPKDYEWSSYKDFINKRNLVFISKNLIPLIFTSKEKFIKETCKNIQESDLPRVPLDIEFDE